MSLLGNFGLGFGVSADVSGVLNSGLNVASNLAAGIGGRGLSGNAGLSIGLNGAGNVNGNTDIDGGFSRETDNFAEDIPDSRSAEIETNQRIENVGGKREDSGIDYDSDEIDDGKTSNGVAYPSYGNVNSQSHVNQYGVSNSNLQGGITQQALRRQSKAIQLPQHIVCGYIYETVYPSVPLHSVNGEGDVVEPFLQYPIDDPMVYPNEMRRFYSGPFNHLL